MKKMTFGMFSLAALVAMATISAKTVRAEAGASLEGAKQESGVEFGEMGELKAREGAVMVDASGAGLRKQTLDAGATATSDPSRIVERPIVPSPAIGAKGTDGLLGKLRRGLPAAGKRLVGFKESENRGVVLAWTAIITLIMTAIIGGFAAANKAPVELIVGATGITAFGIGVLGVVAALNPFKKAEK